MPATTGMHLAYLPQLGVWRRCHPIDLQGSSSRDVDDFRLGSEGDVLRRWIPRRNGGRSGYRVCWVLQSFEYMVVFIVFEYRVKRC